ncbi:DMT family transporter [Acuticoccus sp.]|uniref:DMT family transporter n=1 Tax=Acuticoccus sp. TaxID=1904378 RepID=UPI003B51CFED
MTTMAAKPTPLAGAPAAASLGVALGILAAVVWGAYMAMSRAGANAGLSPSDIAFMRFAVAGPLMLPWLLAHRPLRLAGIGWSRSLVLALLAGPLFIILSAGGYQLAPLAHGAVFQPAAATLGGLAFAALLLGESLTASRVVGAGTILAGLAAIAGPGLATGGIAALAGDAMFVAAGLLWALFAVAAKRWDIDPVAATASLSVLSAAVFVPWYLAFDSLERIAALPGPTLVAQLVVQGVLSGIVAILAYTRAAQLIGASRAAVFPALVPVIAILIGVPVANEVPEPMQAVGIAIVVLGLLTAIGALRRPLRAARRALRPAGAAAAQGSD